MAIVAPVSPNGWISVDLGWIWVGYIQDGSLGPFGPTKIALGASREVRNGPKCHKTRIYGHKWLRWLQMAGSQCILVGSGWDTSRMICWGHLDPPKLPQGPPGMSEMAQKCHKTRIYGHKWLRCLQMAGFQWILVGSGWDTFRMVRWGHSDPLKLPPGPPWGSEMAQKCHKTGISGHRLLRWLQMAGVILARCTYSASLVNYIFCGTCVWCYASSVR